MKNKTEPCRTGNFTLLRLVAALMLACFFFIPTTPVFSFQQQETRPPADVSKSDASARVGERSSSNILVDPAVDYRIGPRDVIEIKVKDAPELSDRFEVNASGYIVMEYLERIPVAGKTPDELVRFIADRLRGKYLKNPHVTVNIRQSNSRSFFIMGAVNNQGVYQIESRASLFTLLILAGGLAPNHGSTAFIFRRTKPITAPPAISQASAAEEASKIPEYEMFSANIVGAFKGQIADVPLEPGDVINIPPTDVYFVAGEVLAPGEFSLKPGTTLRQAISLARGMKAYAAKDRGTIFREDPKTGERKELKVDIGAVMDGKQSDIPLMANDIIHVPNSKLKSFGGAVLNAFGLSSVTRGSPIRY